MKKALMLVVAGSLISQSAWANYACTGTTTNVTIDQYSNVNMSNSSGMEFVSLCNVANPINGISVEACKAMYAMLLASKLSGSQVTYWFSDGLSCTTHPAWQTLTSGSYGATPPGWYWGPSLYP